MADRAAQQGLLPEGLRDALPPEAAHADHIRRQLLDRFASHGYEQVMPPLIEFESGLAGRLAAEKARDMFRLLDSESQQVMVLRSDITGQVARIAATRLGHVERPLRLSYAGTALRVKGSQLRPERQFGQAGVELIGPRSLEAALEVVLLANEAVEGLGLEGISVDLVFPSFVPELAKELGLDKASVSLIHDALDAKDIAGLSSLEAPARGIFEAILTCAGPASDAVQILKSLDLPKQAAGVVQAIDEFVSALIAANASFELTLDPGEQRGFFYQGDFGFSLFCEGNKAELGRGGRYGIRATSGEIEPATGFTLYLDSLIRAVDKPVLAKKVYVPHGVARKEGKALREQGWVTIQGLAPEQDLREEAVRLNCTHILTGGEIKAVNNED
ncbi:MAG: ATP phosphoribosyltransferase regulatory subunit [Sphingomonadales bacterium]|jgi:ATP phosphoribosyltransferase regulatory subunit